MSVRLFLLSPANCSGERARLLLRAGASFPLARAVQSGGAPLGEVFSFVSGLYFRGKVAYARAFGRPAGGLPGALVITPSEGLRLLDEPVDAARLQAFAAVDVRRDEPRFRGPLARDARSLDALAPGCEVVLLGSVASAKYVEPLGEVFGERLRFPLEFAGRGDMSRGGLLLRCVEDARELTYVPVAGATHHGERPPRLVPRPGLLARVTGRAPDDRPPVPPSGGRGRRS